MARLEFAEKEKRMADDNEDELPELDEIIDAITQHQTRLKRDLAGGHPVDAATELVETFLPLMLEGLNAANARIETLDGEVFPVVRLGEQDVVEILEVLQEASAAVTPELAARMNSITEALAAELGDEDDDEDAVAN